MTFELDSGAVAGVISAYPAGTSGACSDILVATRLLFLLKETGFNHSSSPAQSSLSSGGAHDEGIRPMSVQDVDWRSPREYGVSVPTPVRLWDARATKQREQQQLDSFHTIRERFERLVIHHFAAAMRATKGPFVQPKLGLAHFGSSLSYQQEKQSGFQSWLLPNFSMGGGTLGPVPEAFLFEGVFTDAFADTISIDDWSVLKV